MKVRSINNSNTFVTWDLRETRWPRKTQGSCRSKSQFEVGELIKKKYPFDTILEDVTIPETRLSLDFFLPQRKLAFEVQGKQHGEYVPFFQGSRGSFFKQQDRDGQKVYFCELNNIELVTLSSIKEIKAYFDDN